MAHPSSPMLSRLRAALSGVLLCCAGATNLSALDGAADEVRADGLEAVYRYVENTGTLYVNFFVFITDYARNSGKVDKIRIDDVTGTGWDINVEKYHSDSGGYFGGWGSWNDSFISTGRSNNLPLEFKVKITFKDGAKTERQFSLPPPRKVPGGYTAKFVYSQEFTGLVTHMHQPVLGVARPKALWLADGQIHLRFTVDDPAVGSGQLVFRDKDGKESASLWFRDGSGRWAAWLNGGVDLYTDGRENTVDLPLAELKPAAGKTSVDISSVSINLSDEDRRSVRQNKLNYGYWTSGRPWQLGDGPGAVPRPASSGSPAVAPLPMADPGADPWAIALRERWENNLPSLLLMMNGDQFDQLPLRPAGEANAERQAQGLKSDWGITDRDSLVALVKKYLDGGGHSARYAIYLEKLAANPDGNPAELAEANKDRNLTETGFRFARFYRGLTGSQSLMGWDLARLARICRAGFQAGYLSQDETRYWLRLIGIQARLRFPSWDDWMRNYQIGRLFWGGDDAEARLYLETQKAMVKLAKPDSPLVITPWPPAPLTAP